MNIAELILTLHNNTLNPIRRIAKESSISTSQLLCIVSIPTNGINQTNLAALLSIDLSTLSRNLNHLINKKVVIKKINLLKNFKKIDFVNEVPFVIPPEIQN